MRNRRHLLSRANENGAVCPLCTGQSSRPSWMGSCSYDGGDYRYQECLSCGSLYCNPMPDERALARMYGPEYGTSFADNPSIEDPKEPERVVEFLSRLGRGTFVDYGCGSGDLLQRAVRLGWNGFGVEFSSEVASMVRRRTGLRIELPEAALENGQVADVIHLGDVIEHLTHLESQFAQVLSLLRPGGTLLAQGPLEANPCLFTFGLRIVKKLRGTRRPTEMAPYHVMLATARGQRALFERFQLQDVLYRVHEVAWPAPAHLTLAETRNPRLLGLYFLRRLSQTVSSFRPGRWGNRYFYVGRRAV